MNTKQLELEYLEWKPIPQQPDFLESLLPGHYLLHSSDSSLQPSWTVERSNSDLCFKFVLQENILVKTIQDNFHLYNAHLKDLKGSDSEQVQRSLREILESINEFMLMGFDSYVPLQTDCWRWQDLDGPVFKSPLSFNDNDTGVSFEYSDPNRSLSYETIPLKTCSISLLRMEKVNRLENSRKLSLPKKCLVSLRRLEDDLSREEVEEFWRKYGTYNY